MDKTNQMHGESREQQNDTQSAPMQNGNTNDLDSRSHNRDNSGMHAGGTEGSSYRPQPDNKEQYGSKKGSYWGLPYSQTSMNGSRPMNVNLLSLSS